MHRFVELVEYGSKMIRRARMAKSSYLKLLCLATVPMVLGFPCAQCDDAITLDVTLTLESDKFSDSSVFVSIRSLAAHGQSSMVFEDADRGSPAKFYDREGNATNRDDSKYFVKTGWAHTPGYRDGDLEVVLIRGSDTLGVLDTIPPTHWHSLKVKSFLLSDDVGYEILEIKDSSSVDTLYWNMKKGDTAC